MLQNLSTTQTVTIGGPGVTAGHGIQLPFNAATPPPPPTQVPDMGGSATPNGDPIYGIVASTTASVTFMTASWDG